MLSLSCSNLETAFVARASREDFATAVLRASISHQPIPGNASLVLAI